MTSSRSPWRHETLLAVALATLFACVWAWRDWADLRQLRLPDTDDVVRLQQIRDWLGGQAWSDLSQHRLGDGMFAGYGNDGTLAMHWSRLPDLVPGGLIAILTPLVGRHAAEVAAVIVWPGLLFAAALAVVGRIARLQLASAPTAIVVAAVAFPATAMFLPGRIDHHGLQLVLLLALIAALLAPRGVKSGIGIALAGVLSLVIGMETIPFVVLACGLVALGWVAERAGAERHLAALGATLFGGLVGTRLVFAPRAWTYPACDGFTRQSWLAAAIGAAALLLLAVLGRVAVGRGPRLLLAVGVGGLAAVAVAILSPTCLAPYGGVDPEIAARWLRHVGEAQPMFAAPAAVAIGQCGLMLAGIAAGLWALWRTRDPGWAILLLFQVTALAISVWQLRGATAGALLAAPAVALLIGAARARGTLALAGAWAVSAGILYPLAGSAAAPPVAAPDVADCTSPAALVALDRLPRGRVAGPIDLGAWGLAATHHSFMAAPYHRNNWGNGIAIRITDGPAAQAHAFASRWIVDYLVTCGASSPWVLRERPGWLHPVLRHDTMTVYRIDRLPPEAFAL